MAKVGIFFGTDTGKTRRVAKTIKKTLGDIADKPVNVRNATVEDLLQYDLLILGSPTYGEGALPGLSTGNMTESWEEFLPKMQGADFSGKKVALYGLGDQEKYGHHYISALRFIHDAFVACGAEIIGQWPIAGYDYQFSEAVIDDHFVGLALDEDTQQAMSENRLNQWIDLLSPEWS